MSFLKSLELKNFMKHRDSKFDFTNLTIFIGPNGAGKSSILEGISYALFGNTSRKVTNKNLISYGANKESYVKLETSSFRILRSLLPKKINFVSDKVKIDTIQSVNEYVEDYFGISKHHFFNLAYVSQGKLLNVVEMSVNERKKLFDKLFFNDFSLEFLYERFKNISNKYSYMVADYKQKDNFAKQINDLSNKHSVLDKKLKELEKNIEELEGLINQRKEEIKQLQKTYYEASNSIEFTMMLKQKKTEKQEIEKILKDINLEQLKEQKADLEKKFKKSLQIQRTIEDLELLENILDNYDLYLEFDISKYSRELSKQDYDKEQIANIRESRRKVYKVARSSEFDVFEKEIRLHEVSILQKGYNEFTMKDNVYLEKYKFIYENKTEIDKVLRRYKISNRIELENGIQKIKAIKQKEWNIDEIKNKITDITSKMNEVEGIRKRYNKILEDINDIQLKLSKLQRSNVDLEALSDNINTLMNEVTSMEKKLYNLKENRLQIIEETMHLTRDIEILEEKLYNAETYEKKYKIFDDLKFVFSKDGLQFILRQTAYEPLQERFSFYISLFGFPNILLDDSFEFYDSISKLTTHSFSGGQKVAISLALRFALLDILGIRFPLLIIDEPTIHLDDDRIDAFLEIINKISDRFQLVIVTHNNKFMNFSNTAKIYQIAG